MRGLWGTAKSHIFGNRVRKVIISEEKWRVFEGWWRNVQKGREVKNGEWSVGKWSEVNWSNDLWLNVVLLLIYRYEAVCRFCAVHCLIITCSFSSLSKLLDLCLIIFFLCLFLFCFVFLFSIFCIVLCIVSPFVLSLSYFCASLPTAATGWKPNSSK